MSYWDSVPRGAWTVVDTADCLAALEDEESRFAYYKNLKRIHIYGSVNKVIIVDLKEIESRMSTEDFEDFIKQIINITNPEWLWDYS